MLVQSLLIKINKNKYINTYTMCIHTHTHTSPLKPGTVQVISVQTYLLIMNSLAWTKYSRLSDNKFYHPHHLIEIIQGIMVSSFTKSSKVLTRNEDHILVSWIVATDFYEEMYVKQSSINKKPKHH